MPRLTGPLFGTTATGTLGDVLTFTSWNGIQYARLRGSYQGPTTEAQATIRNIMRCLQAGVTWANHTAQTQPGEPLTDKLRIKALSEPAWAWNAALIRAAIGTDLETFAAAAALWASFSSAERDAWDAAAAGLTPPMLGAPQFSADGTPVTSLSAGNVYLAYRYGHYSLGLSSLPTGDPSNWGTPPEPTVQQLTVAAPTTPDWTIPDTYDTTIPGLSVTMTPAAEWVHLSANGEAVNPGTSVLTFTFAFWIPSMFGEAQIGPPCIITAQPGETFHWSLDYYFQAAAMEYTFNCKAKSDISGGQMVSTYATMSVHAMGF